MVIYKKGTKQYQKKKELGRIFPTFNGIEQFDVVPIKGLSPQEMIDVGTEMINFAFKKVYKEK